MSDAERREPAFDDRRPRFSDIRDDDDEFGRTLTSREAARQKLLGPAIGLIIVGAIGILGTFVLLVGLLIEHLDAAINDDVEAVSLVAFEFGALLGLALFVFVVMGGVAMLQLRRRWVALYSAYIVAGLSLAGCYAIILYPFGFWALIVLYQPHVWQEFQRRPRKERND
ncbi:MAG TPA: hypothetical protein VHR66_13455 [Gemmataceae bacterium]|jgi:hypothetical protein|nr:hypothetical protein [Gemmataceae bacterium]